VLDELIGVDADSEIVSENSAKSTPANRLEQPATSESTDIAEVLVKTVSDSARLGFQLPSGNGEATGQPPVLPGGVRDSADLQNQRSVFERPSPDGRGWPEGPGEGYNTNKSLRGVGLSLPPGEKLFSQEGVPDRAPVSTGLRNQKSACEQSGEGFVLYPSPAASRHPLPSGEGRSPLPPSSLPAQTLLLCHLVQGGVVPQQSTKPANLIPENRAPSIDATQIPERLNLADFGVTRFEYKTETEPHLSPVLQSAQMLQMIRTSPLIREIKPVKPASFDSLMQDPSSQTELSTRPAMLTRPDEIQHVRLVFEPPPPPAVVRSVSMDIGDPESQVRVVIRERNGSLNVQLASTNERLREDLQIAGPMLMRELQRDNPMQVTLDFSKFGSATDADSQSRSQPRAKKFLKPDAEFADVVETTYLPGPSSDLKSL
jgi:hypothetical protein